MSLVALAMRIAAVRALQGATAAADARIFDSAILPIDKLASESPEPFISISTEDEVSKPSGRDVNTGDRTIDLLIDIAIGKAVPLKGDGDAEVIAAATDAGLELTLAVIHRQIHACLFGFGGGLWGEAFRAFTKSIEDISSRRGVPNEAGQRFAARQILVQVKAIAEPPFGPVEPKTPFAKFFEAAATDPVLAAQASIIRRAIEGRPIGWPELHTISAISGGYTEAEAAAIGLAPPGAPVAGMTLEPGGVVMDAATASTAPPSEDE